MTRGSSAGSSAFCRSCPMQTRRYWVSSVCAGPHTAVRICLCVITRPACRARKDRSSNSFGVSLSSGAGAVAHGIDFKIADAQHRNFSLALHAKPQRRPHPRQQLADIEGLVDVIVGAEVERLDLLRLAV